MALAPIFASLGTIINAAFGVFMAIMFVQMFVDMIPAVRRAKEAYKNLEIVLQIAKMQALEVTAAFDSFQIINYKKVADSFNDSETAMTKLAEALDHFGKYSSRIQI